jgi:hypothetical protein
VLGVHLVVLGKLVGLCVDHASVDFVNLNYLVYLELKCTVMNMCANPLVEIIAIVSDVIPPIAKKRLIQ